MSWFSNPFGRSAGPPLVEIDEVGKGENTPSRGIKEDLSQISQTFKRQLWGVASFLAPPPAMHEGGSEVDGEDDDDDRNEAAKRDHLTRSYLSEELVDVDFDSLLDERIGDQYTQESKHGKDCVYGTQSLILRTSHDQVSAPISEQGFNGVTRDLAELKGSVASGFSHILRTVRHEIVNVDSIISNTDDTFPDDDDEVDGKSRGMSSDRGTRDNTCFGPLVRSFFLNKKTKDLEKLEEAGFDAGINDLVIKGQNVQPSNFQDGFPHGIRDMQEFASNSHGIQDQVKSQVVGVTEEVLAFAKDISMHPEVWLDFSSLLDGAVNEFHLSTTQMEHIQAVEAASVWLSTLKSQLCPVHISEVRFWNIYFVLLQSRLSKTDALVLSTPKVMEARAYISQKMQEDQENGSETCDDLRSCATVEGFQRVSVFSRGASSSSDGPEIYANKSFNKESFSAGKQLPGSRDEDNMSFSDLEENDQQVAKDIGRASSSDSFDWVQLDKSLSVENLNALKVHESMYKCGESQQSLPKSLSQGSWKKGKSESGEWSTVEEFDAI
ncbi:hypothetical protein KP509_36G022400 [Ceratopteris richardii]|uniref:BSD domain-containing protein n=1 Tax=Ceratopteris richardii TaxID=49495 RepID=A0A8T2QBE2_CERRI|nr:hypothetical protein KP509_36G022400 [Ceratopteris richardii]